MRIEAGRHNTLPTSSPSQNFRISRCQVRHNHNNSNLIRLATSPNHHYQHSQNRLSPSEPLHICRVSINARPINTMIAILPVITRTCNMSVVTRYPILFWFPSRPHAESQNASPSFNYRRDGKTRKVYIWKEGEKEKKIHRKKKDKLVPIDRQKAEE